MPRLLRYSRIAWTAGCGIAVVLLIVLWIRSYSFQDQLGGTVIHPRRVSIKSRFGLMEIQAKTNPTPFKTPREWVSHRMNNSDRYTFSTMGPRTKFGFALFNWVPEGRTCIFPYWFLALTTSLCAAATWLRWSFSLRTLLLSTTAFAVLLGLVVYLQ